MTKERFCPKTQRECLIRPLINGKREEFEKLKTCWHCLEQYQNDQILKKLKYGQNRTERA